METSASCEARYAPLLYPTNHVPVPLLHLSDKRGWQVVSDSRETCPNGFF